MGTPSASKSPSALSARGLDKSQVHWILNELVMGGMVLETNMSEIMLRIEEQNKIEKEEVRLKDKNALNTYLKMY